VFFRVKGFSVKDKDLRTELVQEVLPPAIAYSTVRKHIRKDKILQNEPETEDRADDQSFSTTDNANLEAFEMIRFASIRQIVKVTFIPLTTVFSRVTKWLHFVLKQLRWVHYRLSDVQKQARIIM
jgi:hypothetical protein